MARAWTVEDIPHQWGRTVMVTGASNGIGLGAAMELARHGAHVLMLVRSRERGEAAIRRIRDYAPGASLELKLTDLADLDQVRALVADLTASKTPLDVLINNAGLMMAVPNRTAQGHELHLGVNYLSHFVLTMGLLPLLATRPAARVVTVTSLSHKWGLLDPARLEAGRQTPFMLYSRSKFATALFAAELDRRLRAVDSPVISVLAHPGGTGSNLAHNIRPGFTRWWMSSLFPILPSIHDGARPTLRAATEEGLEGGAFFGPPYMFELMGPPVRAKLARRALDERKAKALWEASERATGAKWPF